MFKQVALAAPLACITTAQAADCDLSQPPGWVCNQIAQAIGPAPGWHGEADKVTGRTIMIPDNLTVLWQIGGQRIDVVLPFQTDSVIAGRIWYSDTVGFLLKTDDLTAIGRKSFWEEREQRDPNE